MKNKDSIPTRTVKDELKNVFPLGTWPKSAYKNLPQVDKEWALVPQLPTDVFAAIGHICRVSGAIGYFNPDPKAVTSPTVFALSKAEKDELERIAAHWRVDDNRAALQSLWTKFLTLADVPLRISDLTDTDQPLEWCKVAFQLLIVADSAAKGIGRHEKGSEAKRFNRILLAFYSRKATDPDDDKIPESSLLRQGRFPATLGMFADRDVVCVQPKSRISQVGCTLRNLSANLALLPPRNTVRCQWSQTAEKPKTDDRAALDILLIPLPYKIDGSYFAQVNPDADMYEDREEKPNWNNFHIKQKWLEGPGRSEITSLVLKLIEEAKRQTNEVDGIIFPEYALDWETFNALSKSAFEEYPELEFIIAGSSSNCEGSARESEKDRANYVLTAVNYDAGAKEESARRIHVASRKKHHRWCLGPSQVREYALASSLNPAVKAWWEDHKIGIPELYFHQFRESSTFVTMICEDLARNDPCHEILRSVGPNLLFALLMDGPQLEQRWSARYASSLADDPGSAVLTFTSYGLIDRMNKTERYNESRAIALWKDDSGTIEKILMPKSQKDCGVLVSLNNVKVKDQTIDGRIVENRSWRFSSQQPIEIV